MILPTKFIYGGMPCLSCGSTTVLNGPAIVDAEHMHLFINGEATMVEYVCSNCPEHWGYYGARNPASPTFIELMEAVASRPADPEP